VRSEYFSKRTQKRITGKVISLFAEADKAVTTLLDEVFAPAELEMAA